MGFSLLLQPLLYNLFLVSFPLRCFCPLTLLFLEIFGPASKLAS